VTDLLEQPDGSLTVDDMLTADARRKDQEKTDKIQDFLANQFA